MGPSGSTNSYNLSQFQYLNQILDPRFGNIKLYQRNETGETVCVIEKIFVSIDNPISKLDHPNILKIYHYKADVHKSVCSSFTKVYIVQEYVSNELRTNIKNRANKQQFYEEKQLWGLLQMCLKALQYLKSFNIYPMDLTNILLSNLGTVKFYSHFNFHNSQYMQVLNQITEDLHLSPEELECLRTREQHLDLDFEKCEIFQLGLTALWAATLADPNSLFSIETLNYSEQEMLQRIEELNYSLQFKNVLTKMLKRFPNERGTFNELLQYVSYHECNENLLEVTTMKDQKQSTPILRQQYSQRNVQVNENQQKYEDYQYQSNISKISNSSNFQIEMDFQQSNISNSRSDIKKEHKILEIAKQNRFFSKQSYSQNRQSNVQDQKTQDIQQLIDTPQNSPPAAPRKESFMSSNSKQKQTNAPKPTGLLQNPLKLHPQPMLFQQQQKIQSQTKTQLKVQLDQNTPQGQVPQYYDTSYFSQASITSNRSALDNKVEDAIMKSKQALAKFDSTLLYTKQYRH